MIILKMRAFITTESLETGPNHSCKCSSELFVYMHEKQIPMQEKIRMKCPHTSHVEGDHSLNSQHA